MAQFVGNITPGISNLRSKEAQGADAGDVGRGPDGNLYRWDGASWKVDNAAGKEVGQQPGSGGGAGGDGFTFDWSKAEADALEKLRPYYEEKLKEANFDTDRAKRLIEEDYATGKRYNAEDLATTLGAIGLSKTRATEDFATAELQGQEDEASQLQALGLDLTTEERDMRANLNNRGVLVGEIPIGQESSAAPVSEYAQSYHLQPFQERSALRRQAIQRAIARQSQSAGVTKARALEDAAVKEQQARAEAARSDEAAALKKTRGNEEIDIAKPRYEKELEQEKREKAVLQMAPLTYQQEYSKWQATQPQY